MAKQSTTEKVNKTQLMHLLNVSYPTALKMYQTIIDSLALKRDFLTVQDLIIYGILS